MSKSTRVALSAMDDTGKPIDWWFIYKVAGKSTASDKSKPTGLEFVYYDSSGKKKLGISPNQIGDPLKGAVSATLNQIYNDLTDPGLGWFFYNDEDPLTEKTGKIVMK